MKYKLIDTQKVARKELIAVRFREIRKARHLVALCAPWGCTPLVSEAQAIAEIEEIDLATRMYEKERGKAPTEIDAIAMLAPWPGSNAEHREALGRHIAGLYEHMGKMRKALGVIRAIPAGR